MTREEAMWEAGERLIAGSRPRSTNAFITAGADAERARVVAWLREEAKTYGSAARVLNVVADAIERGEHWLIPYA
jgi:hypothetical protein